jgi:hypothetical protein
MLDGLSMLIIGGYLAAVIYRGNLPQLLHLLGGEIAFAEWAVAVAALTVVYRNPSTHAVGRGLILLALAGLALRVVGNPNFQSFLSTVKQGGDPFAAFTGKTVDATATSSSSTPAIPALPALPTIGGPQP